MAFQFKTRAEQRLEYLESLKRPLTDEESEDLRRSLHAVYARNKRLSLAAKLDAEWHGPALAEYAEYERTTLPKVAAEEGI